MSVRIEIEALDKTDGQAKVIDFCLTVPAGQIVGLAGRHAAGKKIVLDILAGSLLPDAGVVCLNGFDVVRERKRALRQTTAVLPPTLQPPAFWEALLRDSPPILLLDEPMCCLYGRCAHAVERTIKRLAHEQDKTIILTTCSLGLAQRLCDRVIVMEDGRLAADIPVNHALNLTGPAHYQIRLMGGLDRRWTTWFEGLAVTTVAGETILDGKVADQVALHSLLTKIRDLGLPLLSVNQSEPELEKLIG